jgi:hypothetical protein
MRVRRVRRIRRIAGAPAVAVALSALLVLLAAGCADAPAGGGARPSVPDDEPPPAVAGPEVGPLVCGTASYVDGRFVWTDYAFDDRGPNETALAGGDRTDSEHAGGDAAYPAEAAPGNAADLIQLQIGLGRSGLEIAAILSSLVDADLPVVGVAFDTDADPATGAAALPGGRWPAKGALGVDRLVVVSSQGGTLWTWSGTDQGTWSESARFAATVDPETNVVATVVPPSALDPGRAVWRAFGVVGIAAASGSWLDGGSAIYDLAFVGGEPLIRWQDTRQADVVAGALESSEAAATVDFAKIIDGATEIAPPGPGFHTFLYHSALRLPEGAVRDASGNPSFLGPYQPYAIYLPPEIPPAAPLTIFLHGLQQNHLGAVFIGFEDDYLGTGRALSEDPYQLDDLGFAGDGFDFPPHTIEAYPLARGSALAYRGIAHQDVLDVTDDVRRRFDIDPDRVALAGASMGGIGTYRIGALQPDRWSVILPLIGFQTESLLPLSANLLNVPVRQINGGMDPLIEEARATASAARLDELGYDYRYWLLLGRGHEAGGFAYDCVYADAASFVRDPSPARVVLAVDASLDEVDPASGLALRFDSAYWVAGVVVRDASALASVDATSLALPRHDVETERIDVTRDNLEEGADLCGPNTNVRSGDTWRERAVVLRPTLELPTSNELTATLTNVGRVRFDLARAALDPASPWRIAVQSDGPAAIALAGLQPGDAVRARGEMLARVDGDGVATLDVPAGDTLLEGPGA